MSIEDKRIDNFKLDPIIVPLSFPKIKIVGE